MTAVTMIFEMTRDYDIVIPMIVAVALSIGIRRVLSQENIYTIKLVSRRHFWHYNTNVLGPVLTTLAALKHFKSEGGSIINISSIVGSHARPMATIYSSTKAALDNLTRGLALELGGRGIRVNAIAPGHTRSEGTETMFAGEAGPKLAAESPFNRLGEDNDIAKVVVFLASDDSSWITGEVIRAGGGAI
jgi:3-oxoacyl-[acyl-carrier protein] reductase